MSGAREVWHLTRPLREPPPVRLLPSGVTLTSWNVGFAPRAHALLEQAYRFGGGSVDAYDEWLEWFTSDEEFDPQSCFFAWYGHDLVGLALCWSSAFVKDLCVAPGFRRRGLATALLGVVLSHFRARGAAAVDLRSHADNPSGANELYRKMGFVRQER